MTIPLTVLFVLALLAIIFAAASAAGKVPLWCAVILLCLIELLRAIPFK